MRKGVVLIAALTGAVLLGSVASAGGTSGSIPCDLRLKFGNRSDALRGQRHLVLVFENDRYGAACRVSGFPDVELIGPVYPLLGSIYAVPDQAGHPRSAVLRPGQRAHAVLTWLLPSSRSDRWVPGYIRVVVPTDRGASLAMALPWRFGPVLRQDGATHPGTYVGPVRPGMG